MRKPEAKRKKQAASWMHVKFDFRASPSENVQGFALISATIMLGILLAFSFILLNSSLNTRFVGNVFQQALSAEQIAEAGLHKALFCVKQTVGTNCGGTYGTSYTGETNVTFGNGSFTTTVSGGSTTKTVTSIGTSVTGQTKTVKSNITRAATTTGMTMAAAVQSGAGGTFMQNNAAVTGDGDQADTVSDSDVTSIGDVSCSNGAQIKGNLAVTRSGGKANNCKVTRNAYADQLTNDTIAQDAYYLTPVTGIVGSSVTGIKYPNSATPSPVAFPNLDLPYWEAIAASGGTFTGNKTITSNTSLGPLYIVGDLDITATNVTLTLNGPIHVTGNLTIKNGCIIKLASNFDTSSSVIIVDGTITIAQNGDFQGSGTTGSVLIVVSKSTNTSDSTPAIDIANNVTLGVLYAPYGTVHLKNGANAPAMLGYRVVMDQNTTVNNNGLSVFAAPVNLASTGTSADWHIQADSWREFK